eukprot:TRINITY_DN37066_c0_g1_i3.p2 TRINITY_DN37066_c0_g1~~TRINITY_DN37066_c0_g1_i3.p2  ORF type:complete len:223 (-),score=9.51 TRINITY_DN37066_c0_g1_i3:129-797(-)
MSLACCLRGIRVATTNKKNLRYQQSSSRKTFQCTCSYKQEQVSRRFLIGGSSILGIMLSSTRADAAKLKGFLAQRDSQDGYQFVYPFGWQELQVDGSDVLYKDVIEPLESVSVSFIPTDKQDISEFGSLEEVTTTLATSVLSSPSQEVQILKKNEGSSQNYRYYSVEFLAKARNYTRHAIAVFAVANGKFYTMTTGSNERRWNKMKDKIQTVADSFSVFTVY